MQGGAIDDGDMENPRMMQDVKSEDTEVNDIAVSR